MGEITVAADEVAATELLHDAQAKQGWTTVSSSQYLGPYGVNSTTNALFTDGNVDLTPPNLIGLENGKLHYNVHLSFIFDLNKVLDPIIITFPVIDFTIKIGPFKIHIHIEIPPIIIYWPSVTIPVNFSGVARYAGNFKLHVYLTGNVWKIDAVNINITYLNLDTGPAALMAAISLAASAILSPIPFMGPLLLATALGALAVAIGIGGATNFLKNIVNQFLNGLIVHLYSQPRIFQVLPASSPIDPAVKIRIDELRALVQRTNEDELVIDASISPV